MNLDWYRTFFQLAESGSFSSAAKQMYVTQPAVSRSIAQLERALGCELFYRNRLGVTLTQQGQVLYDNLKNAFDYISAAEKAITEIQTLEKGELKFGASDLLFKFILIPILRSFRKEYPGIKIQVISDNTATIIGLIKSGDVDFGIVNMPVVASGLVLKPIMNVQDCFVVGPKYKFLSDKKIHIEEMTQYPLIMLNKTTNTRKHLDLFFQKHMVTAVPEFEFGASDVLIEFAKNDFGIAYVYKDHVKEELENGRLFELKLHETIKEREVDAAWLSSVPLSVVSKVFIEKLGSL